MTHPDLMIPPTTIPCPEWCADPAGHGFPSEDPGDPSLAFRFHHRDVALIDTKERGVAAVAVQLSCLESARDEQVVELTPLSVRRLRPRRRRRPHRTGGSPARCGTARRRGRVGSHRAVTRPS